MDEIIEVKPNYSFNWFSCVFFENFCLNLSIIYAVSYLLSRVMVHIDCLFQWTHQLNCLTSLIVIEIEWLNLNECDRYQEWNNWLTNARKSFDLIDS